MGAVDLGTWKVKVAARDRKDALTLHLVEGQDSLCAPLEEKCHSSGNVMTAAPYRRSFHALVPPDPCWLHSHKED